VKLYYSKGACSLAVRIALHEIGVACEFEAVNLGTKKTETGHDFLAINPKGAVPALLLDDETILTENSVIQQYLADTHQAHSLLPSIGHLQRYRALEWLNFVSTDLHKTFSGLFNSKMPEEVKENIIKPLVKRNLNFVDHHLNHNFYLMGNDFTLADGYLFVVLSWVAHVNMKLSDWPHLPRYFNEVKKRKAVQQALKEEGLAF
jgi:glutathione S-transferase